MSSVGLIHTFLFVVMICPIRGQQSATDGIYTVVAPKTLRPNSRYNVGVSVDSRIPVKVLVYLTATINSRIVSTSNEERLVEPGQSSLITLAVGDLINGATYNLTVQGTDGLRFQNSTELATNPKIASIIIQTDKPIYKPGEILQFRVLLLDRGLRPYGPGPLDILIKDSQSNVIKKWTGVSTSRGLFTSELPLSSELNLGDWTIEVTYKTQIELHTVTIAEYVLPKFNVEIELPNYATFSDSKIVTRIRSNYVYGKAVKGEVVVAAYPSIHSSYIQPVFNGISRKTMPIDGVVDVEFDLVKELGLTDDYQRLVTVEATVRESYTSRMQNASKSITLHKYRHRIDIVDGSESFKPGLPYKLTLKISTQDNIPVQDTNPQAVTIKYGFSYNHDEYVTKYYGIPSNGLVSLTFDAPSNTSVAALGLEATYKDLTEWFPTVQRALSPSNTYLQISVLTKNPRVNDEIEIEAQGTAPFTTLNYQLLGRGDLTTSRIIGLASSTSRTSFRVRLPSSASPQATLLCFIVHEGEVVADSVSFHVDGAIDNFLNVSLSATQLEPGKEVDVTVTAKPNSIVALKGIDQSVLLLKEDKDLNLQSLETELNSWNLARKDPNSFSRLKRSLFAPIGSSTAAKVFDDAGMVILSNALVHQQPPAVYYRANFLDDALINPEAEADSSLGFYSDQLGIRTRKYFPETFLWQELTLGLDGRSSVKKIVPDTITSWIISGFSLDSTYGLGVLETPQKLTVFRPFFISLNVPYSIIRGEIIGIQVLIHNYLGRDITAEVTLDNSGNLFTFTEKDNEVESKLELFKTERIAVKASTVGSLSFLVVPTKLGPIDLKIRAQTRLAGDAISRPIMVRPPGQTQRVNKAVIMDLRGSGTTTVNLTTKFPAKRVSDADSVKVSFVSDLLGPAITNLDKLLEMPTGCGEQNMVHFVPDILVLEYLQATRQLNEPIREKALKYLEIGYQRELSYRHGDGSFSAFGTSDPSGSTWLTAFVVRSFIAAKRHIFIDSAVIQEGLNWLISKQERTGRFPEVGKIFETEVQGGGGSGIALTAYVTLALVEAEMDRTVDTTGSGKFSLAKNIAMDYLVKELSGLEDPYAISIVAYLLQLSSHPFRENVFNIMESKAVTSENGEMKHWERPKSVIDQKNPWTVNTKPVAVETTAYGLLAYTHKNLIADSLPLVKWLLRQRNERGGFISTQDTVVGLTALSKFATALRSGPPDISIDIEHPGGTQNVKLNQDNAIVVEEIRLPPNTPWVNLHATGTGIGIAQLSWSYNLDVTGAWPLFSLDPQVDKTSNANQLHLSVCTHSTEEESNMAVMELNVPTGYSLNTDRLPNLLHYPEIKRYDTKDADSKLIVYFNSLNKSDVCPTVSAYRVFPVARQAPAYIEVYDYYDNSRRARQFYSPPRTKICDICEEAQCSEECRVARLESEKEQRSDSPNDLSSGAITFQMSIPKIISFIVITNFALSVYQLTSSSFLTY